MSMSERQSLYGDVTSRIIAELEAGRLPWVQPWDILGAFAEALLVLGRTLNPPRRRWLGWWRQ